MYPLQPFHPVTFSPSQPSNKPDGTKNCVQQTSRSPPWGMENGLTLHTAQQKLILLIFLVPAEQPNLCLTENSSRWQVALSLSVAWCLAHLVWSKYLFRTSTGCWCCCWRWRLWRLEDSVEFSRPSWHVTLKDCCRCKKSNEVKISLEREFLIFLKGG